MISGVEAFPDHLEIVALVAATIHIGIVRQQHRVVAEAQYSPPLSAQFLGSRERLIFQSEDANSRLFGSKRVRAIAAHADKDGVGF
jgi:hypothetical protein